jgi:formylglycine-generating enzyme required for sulfatase activity
MNEQPRKVLHSLLNSTQPEYGRVLCEDPKRLRGLLLDFCASCHLEIKLLMYAMNERIPFDLNKFSNTLPIEVCLSRLTEQLHKDAGIDRDKARWAVEAWAFALGKIDEKEVSVETLPSRASNASPAPPARPATPVPSRPRPRPAPVSSSPGTPRHAHVPSARTPGAGTSRVAPVSTGLSVSSLRGKPALMLAGGGILLVSFMLIIAGLLFRHGSDTTDVNVNNEKLTNNRANSNDNINGDRNENKKLVAATPKTPDGMVSVPGGVFVMGNDSDGDELERPEHTVSVKPFFMDKNEVTCAEYAGFLQSSHYPKLPQGWTSKSCPPGQERRPVTGIEWLDANAYATAVGKRLPTEAEWEFAARGTDGRRYPWGNEWVPLAANVGRVLGHVNDVGQYPSGASRFDINDMAGNVWEWTASDLVTYSGKPLPAIVLRHGVAHNISFGKVIRGGSWQDDKQDVTTTLRRGYPPQGNYDYSNTGFRCVKDAVP